ncbi:MULTISPECIES: GNAT family N-acetyltransferase [unclassified Bradyrhizobium]|uniref:GNAT family N-acetyltransferase n=1 Tax=unclassified Bradyrhizobium TaxID=2631580 RepID=UPI002916CCCB|nr:MULTISPECIES: GNAT family N-acetyltransferase [unclassified Bradyrhizobium]
MANTFDTSGTRSRSRGKIDPHRIEFRRLSSDCPRGVFSCGYIHIDHFFQNNSLDNHNDLFARTVTAHLDGGEAPVGFYTMTIGSEPDDQFAEEQTLLDRIRAQFSRTKQLTTVQLIWVGVRSSLHRRGIGTLLMGHALDDFYEIVDRTGVAALTLEPISTNAAQFYNSMGFKSYGSGKRMLLSAEAVLAVRKQASNI